MDNIESTNGMQKSAIIYRDDSSRFVYVCYHCGLMFNECNAILLHIESHFQLVNVTVEPFIEDNKGMHFLDNFGVTAPSVEPIDIKLETPESDDDGGLATATSFIPIIEASVYESTDSKPSTKTIKSRVKGRTKKAATSKKSSSTVSEKGRKKKVDDVEHPFRCHKCPTACRNISMLKTHMQKHTVKELMHLFKCKECNEYFKNSLALRVHVLDVHLKMKKLKCPVCTIEFSCAHAQSHEFVEHLQLHKQSDEKLLTRISNAKDDYSKYEETDVFTEPRYPCQHCTLKFYIKSNLDVHVERKHFSPRRLQCSECYAVFSSPKNYYAHRLEHQRVGPEITETDQNVLITNLDALIDERIIFGDKSSGDPPYRCLICNVTYNVAHDIKSHVRRIHVYKMFPSPLETKKQFICDYCGQIMKSKHALIKHFMIHTDTKLYPCTICGKTFRLNSTRVVHERQHTGDKPYQCHECGKAYISKGLLTAHKKTHEDTTYPCHICGKIFNLPSGYRNHVKTHRQDRPFKCDICGKTFNTKLYLRRHEVIHSDKMYQCRFCDSKFNTGDGRRQHHRHRHKLELSLSTMQ